MGVCMHACMHACTHAHSFSNQPHKTKMFLKPHCGHYYAHHAHRRSKADIKLQLQEGVLTISGERCEEKKAPEKEQSEEGEASKGTEAAASPLRIERRYGAFVRSFSLPEHADADGINASVKDGVLTIVIPKRPETTPSVKDIPIA
jgi:HSP20 family molecular chaperone IbpA